MGYSEKTARFLIESRMADAAAGNADALYDLGIAYSTGTNGVELDLIEAHKWFNLAALRGYSDAKQSRKELSDYMSSDEIATAQKAAREWLSLAN